MRHVPLERDINIAINDPFWVEVANPEHPFAAMLISRSKAKAARLAILSPEFVDSGKLKLHLAIRNFFRLSENSG